MKTLEKLPPYFVAREAYLRAMARYEHHQQKMFTLFGVTNAASLEEAMIANRHLHRQEQSDYQALAVQADKASDVYDAATIKQKQLIATQQKQLNADIAALDE